MRVNSVTSLETQMIIAQSNDSVAKRREAKTTDSAQVQVELLKGAQSRGDVAVMVALAANPNLDSEVEKALAKIGAEKTGSAILRTLAERQGNDD